MKLTPVKSSAVRAIGYDADTREMHVEFCSGSRYAVDDVAPQEHAAFAAALSHGKHFNQHIRGRKPRKLAA